MPPNSTVVERRSLAGELSLFCAQAVAGWVTTYMGKPSAISQPTMPTSLSSLRGQ